MQLSNIFKFLLLASTVSAASSAPEERFEEFHNKARSSGPLKLDDATYDYLTAAPRDYSVAVLLTALDPRFGCKLCQEFQSEWELIGKSWAKGDKAGEARVLHATLDFLDGKGTFQKLMLQTAPILLLFQPTVGPHASLETQPIRNDFSTSPQSANQINDWINRHLPEGPRPSLVRPVNYIRIVAVTTALLGLITLFSVAWPYLLPIIQNRNLWAAVSLIAILLFTSGHMFNHIRKTPYVSGDGRGGVSYFASGFSNQFGLETQIIAAIYGFLAFATISLAIKVPRIADPRKQQIAVYVWGIVMLGMYSFLLSIFRVKNGGYPFWLPPF
ncbi:MAG: oligosaccharyl transferase subunit ost3/OST6 [Chaenotheca gracillima]|nr:MAG: oligosaccharyl transferase subunit ost3/OST6 [Chaenotheca gracillima]